MNPLNKLWTVAKHIYLKQVKSGGFIFFVLSPIIFAIVIGLIVFFIHTSSSNTELQLMVVTDSPAIEKVLSETDSLNDLIFTDNMDEAQTAIQEKIIDGYLIVNQEENQTHLHFYAPKEIDQLDISKEEEALRDYHVENTASEINISDPTVLMSLINPIETHRHYLTVSETGEVTSEENDIDAHAIRISIAMTFIFIMFLIATFYMQILSEELAKEKGTRVMEVILSSMTAEQHFYGKFLGIMMVLGTHILIYIVIFGFILILNAFFEWINISMIVDFLSVIIQPHLSMLIWSIIFTLLGLMIYFALTAFFASLASKTEDAQKTNVPLLFVMLAGFYIAIIFGIDNPFNTVLKVCSFIPFWTPFIMPIRMAVYGVSMWEIWLSLGIMIISLILALYFSTAFYKSNVLTYSDKGILSRILQSYQLLRSERNAH